MLFFFVGYVFFIVKSIIMYLTGVHYNLNCRRVKLITRMIDLIILSKERHKGLTIVLITDLPKFQIVKKLSVMYWNKPSNQIGRC